MRLSVNRIIRFLIWSDLVFYTGWGLINPIFAIFIVERIPGGDLIAVGIATAIYWIMMALLRIPFGIFLDTKKGERDDYAFLVYGLLIASIVPFGYLYIAQVWQLYALQIIHALGMTMSLSGWSAIFTRNIDKGSEATEWGLSATGYSIGTGLAGIVGGYAVESFGFNPVFIGVGILGLLGVMLLLFVRRDICKGPRVPVRWYFNPRDIFFNK